MYFPYSSVVVVVSMSVVCVFNRDRLTADDVVGTAFISVNAISSSGEHGILYTLSAIASQDKRLL